MRIPDVRYARSGDVAIAYQVVGEGPVDLVFARAQTGDLVSTWEHPLLVRHIQTLASFSRLLLFDKRGTGLSDRVREVPTLEARMDDVRAVMDHAESEAAVLWTGSEAARLAVLFAATYPERTMALSLLDPSAKGRPSADYPWAPSDEEWRRIIADVRDRWGTRAFLEGLLAEWAPTMTDDETFGEWFVWHMRRSLSPGAAVSLYRMMRDSDVSDVLASVRVPTLILHRPSERGPAAFFGRHIPNARVVEIPGMVGVFTWVDDEWHELAMRETERLVARTRTPGTAERVLATILFIDVVGSTERLASVGDRAWRETLGGYEGIVRREVDRFGGRELDSAGDGFFIAFDGPARAITCARAVRDAVRGMGLELRSGLHAGECEVNGEKLTGIAVHIGARIAALAQPGAVLVSSTVKDLVAGSGITFADRGEHELKGVPDRWRLYEVSDDG